MKKQYDLLDVNDFEMSYPDWKSRDDDEKYDIAQDYAYLKNYVIDADSITDFIRKYNSNYWYQEAINSGTIDCNVSDICSLFRQVFAFVNFHETLQYMNLEA